MILRDTLKIAEKAVRTNAPAILTAAGVVGTVGTAYLTGKATLRAAEIIREEKLNKTLNAEVPLTSPPSVTFREMLPKLWQLYMPALGVCTLTVGSIVFANRVSSKRLAAVAAAYTVSDRAYSEYKEKVEQHFGKNKEEKVRTDVAQDRVNTVPPRDSAVIMAGGEVLCHEAFTDRYFMSSMETLKKAQNDITYKILNQDAASLSEFYDILELPHTSVSDELGWNNKRKLELKFVSVLAPEGSRHAGTPVLSFEYVPSPITDYWGSF